MADFTKTVELIFGAKDNVTTTVRGITTELNKFDTVVQGIAQPFSDAADGILKFEAALVAAGVAALGFAINDAIKLQSAQLDLQKVLSDSEGSVDQYSDSVKNLSFEYGVFQSDIVNSVAGIKQANFSIGDSFKIVEDSLIATKISELDSAEATDLLIRTLKGFGFEADQSRVILDTWNESSNNFATNTREIAQGLADLSPVAKLAGLTLDETTSLLIPIIEVFGSGTEAANALKTGLLKLIDDTTSVQGAFDALGISQTNLNGTMKSAGELIFEVISRFTELDKSQQLAFTSQLVGINQAGKLAAVFSDENKVLEIQEVLLGKTGSAMSELEIRMKAAEETINRLKVSFVNLQDAVGGKLLVSTSGLSAALTEVFKAITDVVDKGGLDAFFDLINPIAATFADNLRVIAQNIPAAFERVDFNVLADSLRGLGQELEEVFVNIFGDIDITTVEGLASAIQTSVNLLARITDITSGIIDELQPIFQGIGDIATDTSDISSETAFAIGNFLGAAKALTAFGTAVGSVVILVKESGTDIRNVLDIILGSFKIIINTFQTAFDTVALTIAETLRQLNEAAAGVLSSVGLDSLASSFQANANELKYIVDGITDNLKRNASEMADGLVQVGQGFSLLDRDAAKTSTGITKSVGDIRAEFDAALLPVDKFTVSIKKTSEAVGSIESEFNSALLPFDALIESFKNAGDSSEKMVKTVVDGVPQFSDGLTAISTKFKTVADSAEDTAVKTDEAKVKLEELASNERIKTIEATVDLNIANLESQTKIATAILEGLATTISSSADLLGNLYGLLSDDQSFSNLFLIKRGIVSTQQIYEEAAKKQNELVDAQIEMIKAQTDALSRGDSLITIQGDGLAPELEAFMMAVLERIQIRAAADRSLYLLGAPA